jgi:hypothetical protein
MSIVRLVRHQLAWPPHGELRRKSVFASRGSECRVKPAKVVCRARANRNPLRRRATHEEPHTGHIPNFQTVSLGTGVKTVSAAAHFHGFGVALARPWITWVNRPPRNALGSSVV